MIYVVYERDNGYAYTEYMHVCVYMCVFPLMGYVCPKKVYEAPNYPRREVRLCPSQTSTCACAAAAQLRGAVCLLYILWEGSEDGETVHLAATCIPGGKTQNLLTKSLKSHTISIALISYIRVFHYGS